MKRRMAFAKRNRKEILRDPLSLVFLFAFPLLRRILFYLAFHKRTSQFERKNLRPARIGFAHSFLCLFTANLISSDRESDFINRLYTTPLKTPEFIAGYTLSSLPLGIAQTLLLYLLGGLLDFSLFSLGFAFVLLASLLSEIRFIGRGVFFGTLFKPKAVGGICSFAIAGQSILSGRWFPKEGLSEGFVSFRNALPFKRIAYLFVNLSIQAEPSFENIGLPLIILAVYRRAFFLLGTRTFSFQAKKR